jgi:WXG100 family type VII secretion target
MYQTGDAEMVAAVNSMEETNHQLQQALSTLRGEVEQVMGSTWVGTAAAAFQTLMTKFDEDGTKLNNNLRQISEAVTGNKQAYVAQNEQVQQSVSSIASTLGG